MPAQVPVAPQQERGPDEPGQAHRDGDRDPAAPAVSPRDEHDCPEVRLGPDEFANWA